MSCMTLEAKEYEETPYMVKKAATAYCLEGKTCTGKGVREGICASGDKHLLGKTVILYQRLPDGSRGDYIGTFEVEDSGCADSVIDVWQPEDNCQGFMDLVYSNGACGKVYVQILDAVG